MGVISESAIWEDSVLQIEVGDSVGGGPSAVANLQAQDLANRTKFLKDKVDLLLARGPVGALVTMPVDDVPAHCLECDGAEISRGTYPELFAVIGETYGAGDGSTTFNIPDLRGEFIRGFDNGRGIDAGRTIGTLQQDAIQNITGTVGFRPVTGTAAGAGTGTNLTGPFGYTLKSGAGGIGALSLDAGGSAADVLNFDASKSVRTATQTRPRNVAMMYCIVYE